MAVQNASQPTSAELLGGWEAAQQLSWEELLMPTEAR